MVTRHPITAIILLVLVALSAACGQPSPTAPTPPPPKPSYTLQGNTGGCAQARHWYATWSLYVETPNRRVAAFVGFTDDALCADDQQPPSTYESVYVFQPTAPTAPYHYSALIPAPPCGRTAWYRLELDGKAIATPRVAGGACP